jgi:hypothetical protein
MSEWVIIECLQTSRDLREAWCVIQECLSKLKNPKEMNYVSVTLNSTYYVARGPLGLIKYWWDRNKEWCYTSTYICFTLTVLFFRDSLVLCVFSLEFAVFMQWLNTTSPRKVPYFLNSVFESGPAWMLLLLGRRTCLKVSKQAYICEIHSCMLCMMHVLYRQLFRFLWQGSETLNDGREEIGDKEAVPDIKTRWRDFGVLLNRLFFLVYCLIYLILIFMYVV